MKTRLLTLIFLLLFALMCASASAQKRMAVGDKTPGLSVSEWVKGAASSGLPVYINFFSLSSQQSKDELDQLEKMALKYKGKIAFVLVTKDDAAKVKEYLSGKNSSYSVAIDRSGETFSSFGVMYVPFGVLIDTKDRFLWQGKTSQLTEDILRKATK